MILKPKIEAPAGAGLELLEIAIRNPDLFGKTLGEVMSGLPAGVQIVALRRAHHNEPASPEHRRRRGRRACSPSARARKRSSRRASSSARRRPAASPRTAATSTTCACSPRARPSSAGRSATSTCRATRPSVVAQVRRGDTDIAAAARPRARVRRPRRPARPPRRLPGAAQVLRRLDQGHRRVQLHLDRPRHGARLPGRRDPDPAARHRQARDRPVGRADRGADPRQPAPHRRHELDHPAVRQPGAAQPRAHAVPRAGRHVVGAEVRRDGDARPAC